MELDLNNDLNIYDLVRAAKECSRGKGQRQTTSNDGEIIRPFSEDDCEQNLKSQLLRVVSNGYGTIQHFSEDGSPPYPRGQLLRIEAVSDLTTLGKTTITLWAAQDRFVKPLVLSPTVKVWELQAVLDWIEEKKRASNEQQIGGSK